MKIASKDANSEGPQTSLKHHLNIKDPQASLISTEMHRAPGCADGCADMFALESLGSLGFRMQVSPTASKLKKSHIATCPKRSETSHNPWPKICWFKSSLMLFNVVEFDHCMAVLCCTSWHVELTFILDVS